MAQATLTISSKNYSSWSLRGWLLCRMAGLDFDEPVDIRRSREPPGTAAAVALGAGAPAESTMASRSGIRWRSRNTSTRFPEAGLCRPDRVARAHCRAISGEMHSGFYNLRSALPMNLKARHKRFKVFTGRAPRHRADQDDLDECLDAYGGPFLFGAAERRGCDVCAGLHAVPHLCGRARARCLQGYCETIFDWPLMQEWTEGAMAEPDEIIELEVEF
jgi:glutathione S-transferase